MATLDEGPLRFAPKGERSTREQIDALTKRERACFDALRTKWEEPSKKGKNGEAFSDELYLRFARCSPGREKFNESASLKVMAKFDRERYASVNAVALERQLATGTLFPVPGLKTKEGNDMFYMRPSRYFPKETSVKDIIDNLAYCMNTMVERESACTEGIGFLAYMNDWSMKNFDINYCYQFMMMLQGRIPVRVRLFLIVNPPSWFGKIWRIMGPMLSSDFRKKVHVIKEKDVMEYLADDAAKFLPDEMEKGVVNTDQLVQDFITYRKHVEL